MDWISNGEVIPFASSAETMSEGTPSTAKEGADEDIETLSGYGGSTGVCLRNRQAQYNGAAGLAHASRFECTSERPDLETDESPAFDCPQIAL